MRFFLERTDWNQTKTYEALKIYIDLDESGMRGAIVRMMAGGREKIDAMQLTITKRYDMITLFDEHDNRI